MPEQPDLAIENVRVVLPGGTHALETAIGAARAKGHGHAGTARDAG
jgi:hypothetical protein